jgi:hypothetical protein
MTSAERILIYMEWASAPEGLSGAFERYWPSGFHRVGPVSTHSQISAYLTRR